MHLKVLHNFSDDDTLLQAFSNSDIKGVYDLLSRNIDCERLKTIYEQSSNQPQKAVKLMGILNDLRVYFNKPKNITSNGMVIQFDKYRLRYRIGSVSVDCTTLEVFLLYYSYIEYFNEYDTIMTKLSRFKLMN